MRPTLKLISLKTDSLRIVFFDSQLPGATAK